MPDPSGFTRASRSEGTPEQWSLPEEGAGRHSQRPGSARFTHPRPRTSACLRQVRRTCLAENRVGWHFSLAMGAG